VKAMTLLTGLTMVLVVELVMNLVYHSNWQLMLHFIYHFKLGLFDHQTNKQMLNDLQSLKTVTQLKNLLKPVNQSVL
jgi:hypothetical protein